MSAAALSLFDELAEQIDYLPPEDRLNVVSGDLSAMRGLSYFPNFITGGEERVLLWEADREGEWSTHWSRRTKSFGMSYRRHADDADPLPNRPLPVWSDFVRLRLVEREVVNRLPNQMGINEYMPGQGIAPHVDYFGGTVVSLTLGSGCIMDFTHPQRPEEAASLWLPRRSIVVLKEDARNVWRHGIRGRLKDIVDGRLVRRGRRVSLTFRDVSI